MIAKIISWVMLNGATLLGCLQAVIKAIKELLTGVINLISIFIPGIVAQKWIDAVRGVLNLIDDWIEKLKGYLIK